MTDEQRNVELGRLLTILQGYKSDVDELDRMIRAEIARNDKMRAQIAALREQWQARQDAWQSRFDAEDKPSEYADVLTERVYVISVVLEELDALFPVEVNNEEKAS